MTTTIQNCALMFYGTIGRYGIYITSMWFYGEVIAMNQFDNDIGY